MSIREFYVKDKYGDQKVAAEIRCTTDEESAAVSLATAQGYVEGHTTRYTYKGSNKGNLCVWDGSAFEVQNDSE